MSESGAVHGGEAPLTGFDETKRLGAVFARMDRYVAEGELPGCALAVAVAGDAVAEWHAGAARPGQPATAATLWPLASISKTYTAATIMALVERGDLTLSLPVRELLPEFDGDGRDAVRLGHLLTHTAGLIYESPRMEERLRTQTPLDGLLTEAYTTPLLFPPGSAYSYSDFGYALAGRMAEAAAGRPLPDLMRAYVLDPAGLAETYFPAPANTHERIAQVEGALASGTPGAMYSSPYALGLAHPAFGVVASARDLLRFGLLFAPSGRVRVHSEATIRAMTTDRTGGVTQHGGQRFYPFNSDAYGLGFVAGPHFGGTGDDLASPASFGHDGASGCVLLADPTYDLTIALVSNRHMLSGLERWRLRLGGLLNGVLAALTRQDG